MFLNRTRSSLSGCLMRPSFEINRLRTDGSDRLYRGFNEGEVPVKTLVINLNGKAPDGIRTFDPAEV